MQVDIEWNEYLEVLKRSNAPTLIVEGRDDYLCFRLLEEELIDRGFTVFPVEGKENIVEIFRRRAEIDNGSIIFVVDRDDWLFFGVPDGLVDDQLVFTDGWSIENDLLRDNDCRLLMTTEERTRFNKELESFSEFFGSVLQDWVDSGPDAMFDVSVHPSQVLNESGDLQQEAAEFSGAVEVCDEILQVLRADYHQSIRGKSLLALYVRRLSHKDRASKYSKLNLVELCSITRGPFLGRLEQAVRERLGL